MRPLLWKEFYTLRGWLLAGAALLLATRAFSGHFAAIWMEAVMPLSAAAAAIGLAAGQIASERHSTTLDFLLTRPVPASRIVWSKFLAGVAVLAVLLVGIVALGYVDEGLPPDTGLQLIREQVSAGQLFAAMLPRIWFLYAMAFLFSVLVDRSIKAASIAAVVAITLAALGPAFAELAPFSNFVLWLPFFDSTGGLILAARNAAISAATGAGYIAGTVLLAAVSAMLLKRSPERYLANGGLIAVAALVIGTAYASTYAGAHRLPELNPVSSFQLKDDIEPAALSANGNTAALAFAHHVLFLDFSDVMRPRQIADVEIPLWTASSEWSSVLAAMEGGTVLAVGEKKQVPVDETEIAIVTPAGVAAAISLGPVRPGDRISSPILAGDFVYAGVTRDRVCTLLAFDRRSHAEVASLLIDRMRPPIPGREEGSPPVRMLRRGNYLYVSSPSYLSTVDIADPAHPRLTAQLPVHPSVSFLYGFPRPLAWQDGRLLEIRIFPETVASYSLRDPARPVPAPDLTYHEGMRIAGSGRALYRPWRSGVMEFRASGDDFQALRYLKCENVPSDLAIGESLVFALTAPEQHKPRLVQVFR